MEERSGKCVLVRTLQGNDELGDSVTLQLSLIWEMNDLEALWIATMIQKVDNVDMNFGKCLCDDQPTFMELVGFAYTSLHLPMVVGRRSMRQSLHSCCQICRLPISSPMCKSNSISNAIMRCFSFSRRDHFWDLARRLSSLVKLALRFSLKPSNWAK